MVSYCSTAEKMYAEDMIDYHEFIERMKFREEKNGN